MMILMLFVYKNKKKEDINGLMEKLLIIIMINLSLLYNIKIIKKYNYYPNYMFILVKKKWILLYKEINKHYKKEYMRIVL